MKSSSLLYLAILAVTGVCVGRAATETYVVDPARSTVGFSVRRFVSKVPGKFTRFNATLVIDREDPSKNSAAATIDVTSVDTGNSKRDEHLRTADFFDAARYPTITFVSTAWRMTGANAFEVAGDLTLKGVTRSVTLKVTAPGGVSDANGPTRPHWEAVTTIDRRQWAMKDPPMLDLALADEVVISISAEASPPSSPK